MRELEDWAPRPRDEADPFDRMDEALPVWARWFLGLTVSWESAFAALALAAFLYFGAHLMVWAMG